MPPSNIKLSQKAKDQLIKLKRVTKMEHWNELCRWAFTLSLAVPSIPPDSQIPSDSSVEMTWHVFGGEFAEIYWALLTQRCKNDGLPLTERSLAAQFRLHLHRGIGYLAGDQTLRSTTDLIKKVLEPVPTNT